MNITVYCGSNFGDNPHFEEAAHDLGAWIARAGHALVYGGSSVGLMGAVSRAAIEGGAPVIGVEPEFFLQSMDERRFFDQCDLDRCHFPRSVEELERLLATAGTRRIVRCDGPLLQKAG